MSTETNISEVLEKGLDAVKMKIETDVKSVEEKLNDQLAKVTEQITLNGKAHEEDRAMLSNLEKSYTSLKERQDAYEVEKGRLGGAGKDHGFGAMLKKGLEDNVEKLREFKQNRQSISMDLKATMTQAASLTDEVIEATRVPGVKYDPERRQRVRQFLPQGTTNSNAIWYVQETAYTDGVDITVEGDLKGESDLSLTQKSAPVTKIATHFDISEEMLEDISYLSSHISLRGTEKYYNKEDQQLLYGTGLNSQLEGLTVSATDYALDAYTGDANAQEYDILIEAVKQIRNRNYLPSAAMISINRFYKMIRAKDADGQYIMPPAVIFGTQSPVVQGVPIIASNAVSDDDFLVADFPMLTTLFDRKGVNVRFYDQNEDNAVKNIVTVVIEGRLALPTYLPDAAAYGDFATAITNAGNS